MTNKNLLSPRGTCILTSLRSADFARRRRPRNRCCTATAPRVWPLGGCPSHIRPHRQRLQPDRGMFLLPEAQLSAARDGHIANGSKYGALCVVCSTNYLKMPYRFFVKVTLGTSAWVVRIGRSITVDLFCFRK
jgi:hypothetical protein